MSESSSIKWEAAEWVERRMGDEPFDEAAFETWLKGDPGRGPVFDAMWRRIMGSDMEAALNAYAKRGVSRQAWAAGGVVALLAIVGGYKSLPLIEMALAQPQSYAVADAQLRTVTLADGTRLTLAGGASITVRLTSRERVVELAQGTIFADVAHDEERPFRVETGDAHIVDVGTSFEVTSKPANVHVTVASGIVRFGRNGWFNKQLDLSASQAATLDETGLNRVADVDPDAVANWRRGWAEYKGAPLRRVIADLQTLSPLPIVIADDRLANKPLSGRIRLTDAAGQIQNLAIIYGFNVRRTDDALVITQD